jgi:TPR repeat protein
MQNLKIILSSFKALLTTPLILMSVLSPIFASIDQAERQLSSGKILQALETLSPLGDKNDPQALYLMGVIYLSPKLKYFNPSKGVTLLEKAVFQNYGPAIDELAGLYLAGDGVPKDEAKALHYYRQGSYLGYGPSQFNCGIMYKEGQGTEKDPVQAYFHLCLASLNSKDLGDVAQDAAHYRDELVPLLSRAQRQEVLAQVNLRTLP